MHQQHPLETHELTNVCVSVQAKCVCVCVCVLPCACANKRQQAQKVQKAQKVQNAIDELQNKVAVHTGKLLKAERVVQNSAIKQSRAQASVLTIQFTRNEPGAPRKVPQAEYLLLLRKLRDARHRKLVF